MPAVSVARDTTVKEKDLGWKSRLPSTLHGLSSGGAPDTPASPGERKTDVFSSEHNVPNRHHEAAGKQRRAQR
jgi:hypothetical protein